MCREIHDGARTPKMAIQGDLLSMIEQEIDCEVVKLDNKTLIK